MGDIPKGDFGGGGSIGMVVDVDIQSGGGTDLATTAAVCRAGRATLKESIVDGGGVEREC